MRKSAFGAVCLAGLFAAGCGPGGDTNNEGGGGGAPTTTTAVTTTTAIQTTTVVTGTGGAGGAMEEPIVPGEGVQGELPTGTETCYSFSGTAGQVFLADVDAQYFENATNDPDTIDAVITVRDAEMKQIAQNDDPVEFTTYDSRLYTILPADGDYHLCVSDCWDAISNPSQKCQMPKEKANTYYELYLYELTDELFDTNTAHVEGGNDISEAVSVEFLAAADGYYTSSLWGYFDNIDDLDVYAVKLPTDIQNPVDSRIHGYFYAIPSSSKGDGSTAPIGTIWVVDPDNADVQLAALPTSSGLTRMLAPLVPDKTYYLFVERYGSVTGANDFHFVRTRPGWGNPLESEVAMGSMALNDQLADAELLPISPDDPDANSAYVEGEIDAAPTDLDYYKVVAPAGSTMVSAVCSSKTNGTGLKTLKVNVLDSAGTVIDSAVETNSAIAYVQNAPLNGEMEATIRVEAAGQEATITSKWYWCGIHFSN